MIPPPSKQAESAFLRDWWAANDPYPSRFVRFLRWLACWAPFGREIIPDRTKQGVYLLRVYLGPRLFRRWLPRAFLHYFFRGDEAVEFHNHPWDRSWSLILTEGYWEDRPRGLGVEIFFRKPGEWVCLDRDTYHKVTLNRVGGKGRVLRPWTLFFAGRRVSEERGAAWGFYNQEEGTYTPEAEYKAQHAITIPAPRHQLAITERHSVLRPPEKRVCVCRGMDFAPYEDVNGRDRCSNCDEDL